MRVITYCLVHNKCVVGWFKLDDSLLQQIFQQLSCYLSVAHKKTVAVHSVSLMSQDFIREGCLQKLSRKGYQQRMFFLASLYLS